MTAFRQFTFQGDGWQPQYPSGLQQLYTSGSEKILTVSTTQASLPAFGTCATMIYVQVQSADVKARFGGATCAPTATCGFTLAASSIHLWSLQLTACARFIRAGATDAKIFAVALY